MNRKRISRFIKNLEVWKLVIIAFTLLGLILFSLGQAITFGWLSGFPDNQEMALGLTLKSYFYFLLIWIFTYMELKVTKFIFIKERQKKRYELFS